MTENPSPYLQCGDEGTWPNPHDPTEVQWRLRYGEPTREDLMVAASVMGAYGHLIGATRVVREAKVRAIRAAAADALRAVKR